MCSLFVGAQEERDLVFRVDLARKLVKEFAASEEGQLHYQQVILLHVSPILSCTLALTLSK
jgi:hypothetical protein